MRSTIIRTVLALTVGLSMSAPSTISAETTGFSDWLTEPTVFNDAPASIPCPPIIEIGPGAPFCVSITRLRSGFTGGTYVYRRPGNQTPDSILSLNVELTSEVKEISNGTFEYSWSVRNIGTGALTGVICGPNASLFAITQTSPLLGLAGADRIEGTSDDPASFQTYSTSLPAGVIQSKTVFCRLASNPTTERLAKILAPLEDSPTRKEQCKDDGWEDFGFDNQGNCVSYVETGNDSRG